MAIGRLLAVTGEELQTMINKIKIYEGNTTTPTCQLILLADNLDDDLDFTADSEAIASLFSSDYCLNKIYLDQMSVSIARTNLFEAINNGAFYFNYIGHGGLIDFAGNLLMLNDMPLLTNNGKLPILPAMTCLVGNFEGAGYTTLSEGLLLKSDGGVAAVWSPTGFSDNSLAADLDHAFYQAISSGDKQTLGEAVNQALSAYKFNDFPTFMMDIYNILGDPALRLK